MLYCLHGTYNNIGVPYATPFCASGSGTAVGPAKLTEFSLGLPQFLRANFEMVFQLGPQQSSPRSFKII